MRESPTTSPTPSLSRRKVFAGAGTAGALAAVAAVLPTGKTTDDPAPASVTAATQQGGYQLTEHVKRYYQTAKV
jgi:hypothetical protein